MVYSSIQRNYCIDSIAGKSLKNHSEPRSTQRKSILSSVQHTFSVPEKLPHWSRNCKMRTPPRQISRTRLLPLPQERYFTAVTTLTSSPQYGSWELLETNHFSRMHRCELEAAWVWHLLKEQWREEQTLSCNSFIPVLKLLISSSKIPDILPE